MTIHQCPKCELRFDWKTELDDHCWHDHPEFRHEYPAQKLVVVSEPAVAAVAAPRERKHLGPTTLMAWVAPKLRR